MDACLSQSPRLVAPKVTGFGARIVKRLRVAVADHVPEQVGVRSHAVALLSRVVQPPGQSGRAVNGESPSALHRVTKFARRVSDGPRINVERQVHRGSPDILPAAMMIGVDAPTRRERAAVQRVAADAKMNAEGHDPPRPDVRRDQMTPVEILPVGLKVVQ